MEIIKRKEAREKGLSKYFTGKPCKNGHVAERYISGLCTVCQIERASKYQKDYQKKPESKRRMAEYMRERYKDPGIREDQKKRVLEYQKRPEAKELAAEWRQKNKERIADYYKRPEVKERRSEHQKERYASDPDYKSACIVRNHLKRVLLATDTDKSGHTFEIVGYSPDEFNAHIEKQFTEGMTWGNYGEWHIDHIKPIAQFIREGETDPAVINALENLQPLWAEENRKKSDKWG